MGKSSKRQLLGWAIFLGLLIFIFVALSISKFLDDGLIFPSRYNSELSNKDFLFENISDFSDIHFSDLKVSDDKKVFGFYLCENQSQTFSKLCRTLQDNGWKSVDTTNYVCATFSRNYGDIKWLFLECVQVGGGSSVVIQTQ